MLTGFICIAIKVLTSPKRKQPRLEYGIKILNQVRGEVVQTIEPMTLSKMKKYVRKNKHIPTYFYKLGYR